MRRRKLHARDAPFVEFTLSTYFAASGRRIGMCEYTSLPFIDVLFERLKLLAGFRSMLVFGCYSMDLGFRPRLLWRHFQPARSLKYFYFRSR